MLVHLDSAPLGMYGRKRSSNDDWMATIERIAGITSDIGRTQRADQFPNYSITRRHAATTRSVSGKAAYSYIGLYPI